MERRKYHRLHFTIPLELQVRLRDRQESWAIVGLLQNLSLGGAYFVCDSLPQIRRGDVGECILALSGEHCTGLIQAPAQVKRVDHHVLGFTSYGVAVEFLSQPAAE